MTVCQSPLAQPTTSLKQPVTNSYEALIISQLRRIAAIVEKLLTGVNVDELDAAKRLNIALKFINSHHRTLIQLYTAKLKHKKTLSTEEDDEILELLNSMMSPQLQKLMAFANPEDTPEATSTDSFEQPAGSTASSSPLTPEISTSAVEEIPTDLDVPAQDSPADLLDPSVSPKDNQPSRTDVPTPQTALPASSPEATNSLPHGQEQPSASSNSPLKGNRAQRRKMAKQQKNQHKFRS